LSQKQAQKAIRIYYAFIRPFPQNVKIDSSEPQEYITPAKETLHPFAPSAADQKPQLDITPLETKPRKTEVTSAGEKWRAALEALTITLR
jgi:hypothetical protein